MRFAAQIFCLLLAAGFASASVEWSFSSPKPLNADFAVFGSDIAATSQDGAVYALSSSKGTLAWAYDMGEPMLLGPCAANSTSLAVAGLNGTIAILDQRGKETSVFPGEKKPLYMACGANRVYVASERSLWAYTLQGKPIWNATLPATPGALSLSGKNLYLTSGGRLYSFVALTGVQNFEAEAADSFLSKPVEYGDSVYFGSTDGKLYSYSKLSGRMRWSFHTSGAVPSTPLRLEDRFFFGSTDGSLYAVSDSGNLLFAFKAGEGVWSSPVIVEGGGRRVLVFGSTEGKLYGIGPFTGEEIWSFSADGRVAQIIPVGSSVVFSTASGKLYSISASPICSFSSPAEGDVVGSWKSEVSGKAYSDSSLSLVEVRAGGGSWQAASGKEDWKAVVDFSQFPDGEVKLECRASDASGRTESGEYSSITVAKMADAPLEKMSVTAPTNVEENGAILVEAKGAGGAHLSGLYVKAGSEETVQSSPFEISVSSPCIIPITISKDGYEPVSFSVLVGGGAPPVLLFGGLIVLAVVAFAIYKFVIAKRKK